MNRNVRWMLSAGLLLASLGVRTQDRTTVTTLPRPNGKYKLASDTQQPPQNLLPPEPVPKTPPSDVPLVAPGPPAVLIDAPPNLPPVVNDGAYPPFERRVRADLIEAAILFPSVHQDLNAPVDVAGVGTFDARLPSASLGVTAPLLLNIQFDLPRFGELNLGYKLLAAEGNGVLLGFDPGGGAALSRSRLDMNVFDLTFSRSGYGPLWNVLWFVNDDPQKPVWGLKWDIGARFATIFYDTDALGAQRARHISNFFIGGGPRFGLTLHRMLGDSGMRLFGRVDFGANLGSSQQKFSQLEINAAGAPVGFGYAERVSFRAVPTLAVLAGLGGESMLTRRGSWQVGYQFEEWFNFGNAAGSNADLISHGIVMRWEYKY